METCPKCGSTLRIKEANTQIEEKEDKILVYSVQDLECVNPSCTNYDHIVDTSKFLLAEKARV